MSLTQSTALLGPLFLASRLGINVLSALGAAPATNDLLPLYDTDAGSNKSVTVANLTSAVGSGLGLSGLVDNSVIRANGATGLQGSGLSIDDSDNLTGVASLTVTGGSQNYTISGLTNDVLISGTGAGIDFIVEVQSADNDSTRTVGIEIDAVDSVGMASVEGLFVGWDAPNARFSINTDIGATATDRDLYLHTHGNAGQLVLNTAGNVTTSGDLTVGGDLTVNGSVVTLNTANSVIEDPLIKLGLGNTADTVDLGWYAEYDTGTTAKYTGLFRDATGGKYRLFSGLQAEPTTTVNIAGTGYAVATLVANLEVPGSATFAGATISDLGTVTTADINGGTVDGTVIGGSSAAAATVTTLTLNDPGATGTRIITASGASSTRVQSGGGSNFLQLTNSSGTSLGYIGSPSAGTVALYTGALSAMLTVSATSALLASGVTLNLNGNTLQTAGGPIASSSGTVSVSNHINLAASQTLRVNGTQVVTSQQSAISAPSGGTTIDTEARTAIGSILTALRTHGLIAT